MGMRYSFRTSLTRLGIDTVSNNFLLSKKTVPLLLNIKTSEIFLATVFFSL